MLNVDCVVFDLMDTLVSDPFREALRAGAGMSLRELAEGRDLSAWMAFERGEISEPEYWQTYADQGVDIDVEAHHRARRDGYAWLPGMRDLVLEVADVRDVAVASNYSLWIDELTDGLLAGVVTTVISSHRLGCRKPDRAFYDAVADRVCHVPGRILFVDDRDANIDGAIAAGMDAVRFEGAPALRRDLMRRGVLPD